MIRRFLRALRFGYALLRLEEAERGGARVCLHSSWCAADHGYWVALIKPAGWAGAAMGHPIMRRDLGEVLELAEYETRRRTT